MDNETANMIMEDRDYWTDMEEWVLSGENSSVLNFKYKMEPFPLSHLVFIFSLRKTSHNRAIFLLYEKTTAE
jgi:hypothetical protein